MNDALSAPLSAAEASSARTVVLLVNLGTPDAPTPQAVRRFLRQFLSDPRVIEIPRLLWWLILNLFVLPFRPKRVAHAYASIWQGDSPMRMILQQQVAAVSARLQGRGVMVLSAMSYGQPSIPDALDAAMAQGIEQVVVLPLFPQYSATSSGAVYDAVNYWQLARRNLPSITLIKDYYAHPRYIGALAESVRRYQAVHGVPDKLLMSFHGIPIPYAERGDPYPERCQQTAQLLAAALGLSPDRWAISFQSRFGKQEWVKPYTSVLLTEWGSAGVGSVQVLSPAFSADCLETLEELAVENRDVFLAAGGKDYAYISALNSDAAHIDLIVDLVEPLLTSMAAISLR